LFFLITMVATRSAIKSLKTNEIPIELKTILSSGMYPTISTDIFA
jgi:hypothetical protein